MMNRPVLVFVYYIMHTSFVKYDKNILILYIFVKILFMILKITSHHTIFIHAHAPPGITYTHNKIYEWCSYIRFV